MVAQEELLRIWEVAPWASRSPDLRDIVETNDRPPSGGLVRSLPRSSDSRAATDKCRVDSRRQTAMLCAEIAAGAAAAVAAALITPVHGSEGLPLVVLFLALAIASDAFEIVTGRGFSVSGSLLAIVLAIGLTGP